MRFALHAALCAALIASCQSPPTQVVVRLATNLAAPGELDTIQIEIFDNEGFVVRDQTTFDIEIPGDLRYHEIGSFGVLPRDGDASRRFEVRATALSGGVQLFQTRVISSFVHQRTIRLDLYLPRSCLTVAATCEPDETCGVAGCVSPEVDASRLPIFDEAEMIIDETPVDPRSGATFISPGGTATEATVARAVRYTIGGPRTQTIYYTLDGSEPTVGGAATMSGPSPLTLPALGDATIRWFGVDEGAEPEPATHTFVSTLDAGAMRTWGIIVEDVDLDGAGPFAEVDRGATVNLSFHRQIWRAEIGEYCECCISQLVVGVEGVGVVLCEEDEPFPRWATWPGDQSAPGGCGGPTGNVTAGYSDAPVEISFVAPAEPGQYPIRIRRAEQFLCADVGTSTGGATIAVLVVR